MKPSNSHRSSGLPAQLRQRGLARTPHSALRTPPSESAVALVVTLIMLSVITFMAITFLVLSRSEHGAVATETDQTQARLAAETGLQRAIAEALAPMLAQTNEFQYGLMVSTNYINPLGFASGVVSPANVNYDYKVGGAKLSFPQDWAQNIGNLWFDPRPPVFITNRSSAFGGYEFRFFHNLNRNTNLLGAVFDPTGWLAVTNNGVIVGSNWFVGDPQWIGILNSPDRRHAADNQFVSRFAYLLMPVGKGLDFNYIHNYAKAQTLGAMGTQDGFLRNQGVGAWEENLAGFLVDLNTNLWPYPLSSPSGPTYPGGLPYAYSTDPATPNGGTAFQDAFSLLRYRYSYSANSLLSVRQLYGLPSVAAYGNDYIDSYVRGPVNWVSWPPPGLTADPDVVPLTAGAPWSGSPNPTNFFTPEELLDRTKQVTPGFPTSPTLADRLIGAGNNTQSSYDQNTFYRMLSQLGSDTAGDSGRINLNYCNMDSQNHVVPNMETNFLPWIPEQFFTNTANALLRTYGYNFTVTNIQIYPTNFYSPNVHRLLQVAANIYDASTNRLGGALNLPTVFRPVFRQVVFPSGVKGVVIAGYREVVDDLPARLNGYSGGTLQNVVLGMNQSLLPAFGNAYLGDAKEYLVQGIPLIIGAKKGLPNFNEFGMEAQVTVQRKLQFRRSGGNDTAIVETNQMYLISVTNTFGLEAWNSYFSAYPRPLQVRMDATLFAVITNDLGMVVLSNAVPFQPNVPPIAANTWQGFGNLDGSLDTSPKSFRAVVRSFLFLTNSMYSAVSHRFVLPVDFERGQGFPIPHLFLSLRPMVRFALVDTSVVPNRIVDYVSLDSPQVPTDLTPLLMGGGTCDTTWMPSGEAGSMWCTNRANPSVFTPTFGILNQMASSLGLVKPTQWTGDSTVETDKQIDFFRAQFGMSPITYTSSQFDKTNTFQSPYSPQREVDFYVSWQANDPLVHYTIPDLADQLSGSTNKVAGGMPYELDVQPPNNVYTALKELGGLDFTNSSSFAGAKHPVNTHYRPWGGNPKGSGDTSPVTTDWRLELKDPLVTRSDAWDFPTNKYPSIGWLGRVHRGTPWQTIYLKSTTNDWTRWRYWSGDNTWAFNYDARGNIIAMPDHVLSLPEGDRSILDLFSAALDENAAHGRLSVNQDGLAAWSAILSGVVVLTNTASDSALISAATHPQLAPPTVLQFTLPQAIPPAGQFDPYTTPTNLFPAVARIVNGINTARARHADYRAIWWNYYGTNVWTNTFEHVAEVLAVPELTVASPFLNRSGNINKFINSPDQKSAQTALNYQTSVGITDEMYERIPQQILGLLQCDHTPRFVIYAYGQALKPAPHSIYTVSGPYFQLCTNYQITAEVATRAVVRIDGAPSHPHAVIENFNVLPPD